MHLRTGGGGGAGQRGRAGPTRSRMCIPNATRAHCHARRNGATEWPWAVVQDSAEAWEWEGTGAVGSCGERGGACVAVVRVGEIW